MTKTVPDVLVVDIAANRRARKWTRKELLARACWALAQPLFSWSPRPLWAWRRWLLRLFGATIGAGAHVYPTVRITIPWNVTIGNQSAIGDRVTLYALGCIRVGDRVTVSQGAHLCAGTHDYCDPAMPLVKSPIVIEDDAWICADAFVGPGVVVGSGAIAGACSVVMKDVAPRMVVAGNPARVLRSRAIRMETR